MRHLCRSSSRADCTKTAVWPMGRRALCTCEESIYARPKMPPVSPPFPRQSLNESILRKTTRIIGRTYIFRLLFEPRWLARSSSYAAPLFPVQPVAGRSTLEPPSHPPWPPRTQSFLSSSLLQLSPVLQSSYLRGLRRSAATYSIVFN